MFGVVLGRSRRSGWSAPASAGELSWVRAGDSSAADSRRTRPSRCGPADHVVQGEADVAVGDVGVVADPVGEPGLLLGGVPKVGTRPEQGAHDGRLSRSRTPRASSAGQRLGAFPRERQGLPNSVRPQAMSHSRASPRLPRHRRGLPWHRRRPGPGRRGRWPPRGHPPSGAVRRVCLDRGRPRGVGATFQGHLQVPGRLLGRTERAGPGRSPLQVMIRRPPPATRCVGRVRYGVQGLQVVLGGYRRDLAREVSSRASRSPRDRQVDGLAVAAGQRAVGHLADHRLHEPVLPELGAEPVRLLAQDLEPDQRGQRLRRGRRTSGAEPGDAPRG